MVSWPGGKERVVVSLLSDPESLIRSKVKERVRTQPTCLFEHKTDLTRRKINYDVTHELVHHRQELCVFYVLACPKFGHPSESLEF